MLKNTQILVRVELQISRAADGAELRPAFAGLQAWHRHVNFLHSKRVSYPHDVRLLRQPVPDNRQGRFDRFPVSLEVYRQVGPFRMTRREAVDDRGAIVHRLHEPRGRKVGESDAGGVAVRPLRQPAHENVSHLRLAVGHRLQAERALAADDVRVHSGAADVFADLIDDQEVGVCERQPCQPPLGEG